MSDRQRLGKTLPPVLRGVRGIEDVSGPQHRIDAVLLGERQDLFDDCESGARELTAIVGIELAELAAQVQIGGVEQLQHPPSPVATSNCTSRTRTMSGFWNRRANSRSRHPLYSSSPPSSSRSICRSISLASLVQPFDLCVCPHHAWILSSAEGAGTTAPSLRVIRCINAGFLVTFAFTCCVALAPRHGHRSRRATSAAAWHDSTGPASRPYDPHSFSSAIHQPVCARRGESAVADAL